MINPSKTISIFPKSVWNYSKTRRPMNGEYALYYDKLAAALHNRGVQARANDLMSDRRYSVPRQLPPVVDDQRRIPRGAMRH